MNEAAWADTAVIAAAAITTFVLTEVVRRFAWRVGAVVRPDERRVHLRPTPTLGGMAMFGGLLVAVLFAWANGQYTEVFANPVQLLGIIGAAAVIHAVGVVDDFRQVSAPAKVAGVTFGASLLVIAGVSIVTFRVPTFGLFLLSDDLVPLVTVLWVLAIANAINLIDGLDGLAAGIVAIAAGSFLVYSTVLREEGIIDASNPGPLVAMCALGVCLGFLPHNVSPARIFMGDGGSLLLGSLMAAATVSVGGSVDEPFSGQAFFFYAPLLIPLFVLGVPLLDTVLSIVRRAIGRKQLTEADKDHLHYQLVRMGHGNRRAVLILWAWTALLSGLVLYPTLNEGRGDALVPIGVIALGLGLYTFLGARARGGRENG